MSARRGLPRALRPGRGLAAGRYLDRRRGGAWNRSRRGALVFWLITLLTGTAGAALLVWNGVARTKESGDHLLEEYAKLLAESRRAPQLGEAETHER